MLPTSPLNVGPLLCFIRLKSLNGDLGGSLPATSLELGLEVLRKIFREFGREGRFSGMSEGLSLRDVRTLPKRQVIHIKPFSVGALLASPSYQKVIGGQPTSDKRIQDLGNRR